MVKSSLKEGRRVVFGVPDNGIQDFTVSQCTRLPLPDCIIDVLSSVAWFVGRRFWPICTIGERRKNVDALRYGINEQCAYNVTLKRVRVTTVAVEEQ